MLNPSHNNMKNLQAKHIKNVPPNYKYYLGKISQTKYKPFKTQLHNTYC